MNRFPHGLILAQVAVTLLGITAVLGTRIEHAADFLVPADLEEIGLQTDAFRTYRSYRMGRMDYRVTADVRGQPVYIVLEIEAGAFLEDYERLCRTEEYRNKRNKDIAGYHEMVPLADLRYGFVVRMRRPVGLGTKMFDVSTEIVFFRLGHRVVIRVTRTEVPAADVEKELQLSEYRARRIMHVVRDRCR